MEPEEYFIKGKMYVFGGFDTSSAQFMKEQGLKIRDYFWVYGGNGKSIPYYPKIGNYFMCLDVKVRPYQRPGIEKQIIRYAVRFLAPDAKIVTDFVSEKVNRSTIEKWKLASQHFE